VDLSLSTAGRFSGLTAAAAATVLAVARLLTPPPPPRSELCVQLSRVATRGVGGADHSLRVGAAHSVRLGGGEDHSTRLGGGEDHSTRLGGGDDHSAARLGGGGPAVPAAAILRPAAAGRKLESDGLSVRKLSVASSDLKKRKQNHLRSDGQTKIPMGNRHPLVLH
jgi:hypothetical protein